MARSLCFVLRRVQKKKSTLRRKAYQKKSHGFETETRGSKTRASPGFFACLLFCSSPPCKTTRFAGGFARRAIQKRRIVSQRRRAALTRFLSCSTLKKLDFKIKTISSSRAAVCDPAAKMAPPAFCRGAMMFSVGTSNVVTSIAHAPTFLKIFLP